MTAPLVLRDVRARYPDAESDALDGASVAVAAGEFHALIGPNGSGKSTLLRAAAGLLRTSAGQIELAGAALDALRPRERARRVALVPQGLEAIPDCSVAAFVHGGRYAHARRGRASRADDDDAVRRALEVTSLTRFAARRMARLSGGERQRALVARALAQDTPVLLGDEPTASLDPDQQIAVLELFAARAHAGRAVLVVTHDLNLAGQFADRITLLDEGRVVVTGTPREVLCERVLRPVLGELLRVGTLDGDDDGPPVLVVRRPRLPRAETDLR